MNNDVRPADDVPRPPRRALFGAVGALAVLFVGGAVWAIPTIQDDLTHKVSSRLAADGVDGVVVHLSGQDATLACSVRLADPAAVQQAVQSIEGVREVNLEPVCTGATTDVAGDGSATTSNTTMSSTTSTSVAATDDLRVSASLADGAITLAGTVGSDAQVLMLVGAADQSLAPQFVTSKIVVEPGATVDTHRLESIAGLVTAMPPNLIAGELTYDGTTLTVSGVYADSAAKSSFEAAAAAANVTADLQPRPSATAADALKLQTQLNDYVSAHPVLFESNKAVLAANTAPILDMIAAMATQLNGVTIEVQGHTDTTGDAGRNLKLSQERANSVLYELVSRGVPFANITAKGYGVTKPKVPNTTAANRAINRRVEFVVTVK